MEISNNWTIVIGVATIVSMILLWSKRTYLDPIFNKEESIIKKVKGDLKKKLSNHEDLISKVGEEKFVDEVYDIVEFRKMLRELKETFGRKMVPSGILLSIFSIVFVSIFQYNISWLNLLIGYLLISLSFFLIKGFLTMRNNENLLSRYWEGEDPTIILKNEH